VPDGWSGNWWRVGLQTVRDAALANVSEALQGDGTGHAAAVAVKRQRDPHLIRVRAQLEHGVRGCLYIRNSDNDRLQC
jgi:hypothetical protein